MENNAPGQLFGYTIQYPRALLKLLESKKGEKVAIEVYGDVAVISTNNAIQSEEDKSSLNKNPVTNRSVDLWKTFYNWIKAIHANILNVDTDHFVLYVNYKVPNTSFVVLFANATTQNIDEILSSVETELNDITDKHDAYTYINYVLHENRDLFKKLLLKFNLENDSSADSVYENIKKYITETLRIDIESADYVSDSLNGWLQETTCRLIANNQNAIISKESFDKHLKSVLLNLRTKRLIDFAKNKIPSHEDLLCTVKKQPVYIRQLEYIDIPDEKLITAVSDYFRADTNRLRWIEQEIITADDMQDFEGRLYSSYENTSEKIMLVHSLMSDEEKGRLIFNECQSMNITLANQTPPNRTIQGSYLVLSDEKRLGWHPQWVHLLEKDTEI